MTAVFTLTQLLAILALIPCILTLIYLFVAATQYRLIILPVLFFSCLAFCISRPLLAIFPLEESHTFIHIAFLLTELSLPILSALLIMQCITTRPPSLSCTLLFTSPLLLGSIVLLFIVLYFSKHYLIENCCFLFQHFLMLFRTFSTAAISIAMIIYMNIYTITPLREATHYRHKYWLIISLIIVNITNITIDLAILTQMLSPIDYLFTQTMIRMAFIYLIFSSIFRIFTDTIPVYHKNASFFTSSALSPFDLLLAKKIIHLMEDEHIYRDMELNRTVLAEKLSISEHKLSRIINRKFKQSFSELLNAYRITDAKKRLLESSDPITNIAFDTGFRSISSFNRVFKELEHLSPSQYRKQHANLNESIHE